MLPSHGPWYDIGGLTYRFKNLAYSNHHVRSRNKSSKTDLSASISLVQIHAPSKCSLGTTCEATVNFHWNHWLRRRLMMQVTADRNAHPFCGGSSTIQCATADTPRDCTSPKDPDGLFNCKVQSLTKSHDCPCISGTSPTFVSAQKG